MMWYVQGVPVGMFGSLLILLFSIFLRIDVKVKVGIIISPVGVLWNHHLNYILRPSSTLWESGLQSQVR